MSDVSGPNYLGKVSASSTKFFSDSALAGGGQSLWTQINSKPFPTLVPMRKNANVIINGDLTVSGTFNNPSDVRLKDNICDLPLEHANLLMTIHPKSFTFKNDQTKSTHFGFIAQEVEEVCPNLVKTVLGDDVINQQHDNNNENNHKDETNEELKDVNHHEYKCVSYLEMIPLLLLKIQNLQAQIDELKANAKKE